MLESIISKIDNINSEDPNSESDNGEQIPKELLYSQRMTKMLFDFEKNPSDSLQISARGQHIRRWAIPRSDYPMDKKGYMKWRTVLKTYHAELVGELMSEENCSEELIDQVKTLITKRKLKTDPESKTLEDVVCLVFMQYYFSDFARKHEEEKVLDIVRKTWAKMTERGHDAALKLPLGSQEKEMVLKSLSDS